MRQTTKITLATLAIAGIAFSAGSMAGADSVGIRITEKNSNWQGPGFDDPRSVFFERNKETFDNGYYRYCTAANSNVYRASGSYIGDVSLELDCTPVFSPDGVPVSE